MRCMTCATKKVSMPTSGQTGLPKWIPTNSGHLCGVCSVATSRCSAPHRRTSRDPMRHRRGPDVGCRLIGRFRRGDRAGKVDTRRDVICKGKRAPPRSPPACRQNAYNPDAERFYVINGRTSARVGFADSMVFDDIGVLLKSGPPPYGQLRSRRSMLTVSLYLWAM